MLIGEVDIGGAAGGGAAGGGAAGGGSPGGYYGRGSPGLMDAMRQTLADSGRFDEGEGVNIGIGVYYPMSQPSDGAMHDVVTQSYLLPVIHHR